MLFPGRLVPCAIEFGDTDIGALEFILGVEKAGSRPGQGGPLGFVGLNSPLEIHPLEFRKLLHRLTGVLHASAQSLLDFLLPLDF